MTTTVIGGGVVGLSSALELLERGEDVTVLEAAAVGQAASKGNAGWVTPFLSTPRAAPGVVGDAVRSMTRRGGPARIHPHLTPAFAVWMLRFLRASRPAAHRRGHRALQRLAATAIGAFDRLAERKVVFEEHRQGLSVVALSPATVAQYEQLHTRMAAEGYCGRIRVLRGGEVCEFDPAIRRDVAGVVHLVDERHVRPETLTRGLTEAIRARGGTVHEYSPVTGIAGVRGTWVVSTGNGLQIASDRVVVAAGWRSRDLLRPLGVDLPLEAARGTSLTARGEGTAPRHPLKLAEHMVACSPFDGEQVRLSGTFDVGARGARVNRRRLEAVVEQGMRYLEDWRPAEVCLEWVGHRPTTPDDLPVIGPVPGRPGLFVNTGHGTLGLTLGPTTGALLAEEICASRPQELLSPFRINRFW